ncbi:uncharacterized protein [Dysidea avara]|uniref:uncharacterized protein n=1 Tax=Dysidea avara TaxID=196820 RepID=UPI0033166361
MCVDLAAQVMSSTVAKELRTFATNEAEATAEFIELVDKMFDSMNVSLLSERKLTRKAFLKPYRKPDDFRLKFLRDEVLPYFQSWEASVRAREGYSKKEINLMLLSKETRDGITRSVNSFLELVEGIFKIPGVTCFLSNRICQDPLEKYFSMQCQSGATNDNPTVHQFVKNSDTIRLVGNMWFEDTHGNCRKSSSIKQFIEYTKCLPLRKRKRNRRASL